MKEYHKIQSIFKRDEKTHKFIEDNYSLPEFEYLKDNIWVYTEKIDGTNVRVLWDKEKIAFKGKSENAQMPTFLYSKLQEIFIVEKFKELYPETPMCLCGEGYGARIQKGGGNYISDGVNFILFDVMIEDWWLKREDVEDIAQKLGVGTVPIVEEGTLSQAVELIKSQTLHSKFGEHNFLAEGLVLKPKIELKARNGKRIITKLKHKDFGG